MGPMGTLQQSDKQGEERGHPQRRLAHQQGNITLAEAWTIGLTGKATYLIFYGV